MCFLYISALIFLSKRISMAQGKESFWAQIELGLKPQFNHLLTLDELFTFSAQHNKYPINGTYYDHL